MDKNNLLKRAFILEILLLIVGDVVAQTDVAARIGCIVCKVGYILIMIVLLIAGIVMLMAGIKWISSADDPAARGAARLTIIHVLIGLTIIVVAFILVEYLFTSYLGLAYKPSGWIDGCTTECT